MTTFIKQYKGDDKSYVELHIQHLEGSTPNLEIFLRLKKSSSQIINKLRAALETCIKKDILRTDEEMEEDTPQLPPRAQTEILHVSIVDSGKLIEINGTVSLERTIEDTMKKIEKLLFNALATHLSGHQDAVRYLGNLFWLPDKKIQIRLNENVANEKEKPKDIQWKKVEGALRAKNIKAAFNLISNTVIDDELLQFIHQNRPTNDDLLLVGQEWTQEDSDKLILKIIIFVIEQQNGVTPETKTSIISLAQSLLGATTTSA